MLSFFVPSVIISVIYHIVIAIVTIPGDYMTFVWSAVVCICIQSVLFWNGIICVYLTSYQMGIKQRVIGVLCGMIPIVNLIVLRKIIKTVLLEVEIECKKEQVNIEREAEQLCKTRYPLLLVHGVFFRDNKFFNYWGRIPKELIRNGAVIFYGNHQSAASIADSAIELAERIKQIVEETGCEKLNIIAHSKGGLDCRYALDKLNVSQYVASLTTVNTPHRGCLFADFLLKKIDDDFKNKVAETYNKTLKKLGDKNPDFLAAVNNLTDEFCQKFDDETPLPDGVYCQSIGSVMKKGSSGSFPLNFTYHLAKFFYGENDGLVSEQSFKWSENYTLITNEQKKGISHADIIDLSRENIDGFDAREFYVKIVNALKKRGL
jgi:triacylglycerol lipase